MKFFEEWKNEFYRIHPGNLRFTPTCEMGWKAALEWVKANFHETIWTEHCLDFIEEELKSSQNNKWNNNESI